VDNVIVPNFNSNLIVLRVLDSKDNGIENTEEFPIIAWKISEDDFPVPVCVDMVPERDEVGDFMVFDRATKTGIHVGLTFHSREECVKELHSAIKTRQSLAKPKATT